jgi:hypothetical protein
MRKIAKNKQQSTNRLEYMDPPVHPAAAPPPAKEVAMPPAAEAAKTFVLPEAAPLSDDDEVQIVIRSYWQTLIVQWQVFAPQQDQRRTKRNAKVGSAKVGSAKASSAKVTSASSQPQPERALSQPERATRGSQSTAKVRNLVSMEHVHETDIRMRQGGVGLKGSSASSRRRGGTQ